MTSTSDYTDNKFEGKKEQMEIVVQLVLEKGFIPQELVLPEVEWFYNNLGIDDIYFILESNTIIANHIISLYAAKIQAYTKQAQVLDIQLERETESGAIYMHTSKPGISDVNGPQYERVIDSKYLDISNPTSAYRLESYRSLGVVSPVLSSQLRCYFLTKCEFSTNTHNNLIADVADKTFKTKASRNTMDIYTHVMEQVLVRSGPVIKVCDTSAEEKRLVIGYKQQTTNSFFSTLSDLYHFYSLYSTRKYVEQFSNGISIICIYLRQLPLVYNTNSTLELNDCIYQIVKECSLLYCLPIHSFTPLFTTFVLSVQESTFSFVCWIFCQHFLNRLGNEWIKLSSLLDSNNQQHSQVLTLLKKRLRQDTFTREYILEIMNRYPQLLKLLYTHFCIIHHTTTSYSSISMQRLNYSPVLTTFELTETIRKTVVNTHELLVFDCILTFNTHILKTNFYQPTKVALSFRLDPTFLPSSEYPTPLYGMLFVIGNEFRGFHLRFRDIARGGIRIIRSRNREAYSINLRSLFDENYALAATQQRKNKDIPEGGSKGTILLNPDAPLPRVAFEKYVDSVLDLLIPGNSPGIKEAIVDLYGKDEILFFGPDEGTADYMDWASCHARHRGARFWKAFTTGKSQSMGGIPHDGKFYLILVYGMTTHSVHQYVVGIYSKLGLVETKCKKFQTGGPDGDLGSNEIKISSDKTTGIVDGSGVLYDPTFIDSISHFDLGKLGHGGFRVLCEQVDVVLPDGTRVASGFEFRNGFHLTPYATNNDLFVPCGGRPEAVDLTNVDKLINTDGTSKYKYIVEGANLFFTQEARLRLEKAGALIFKDASANKGGVTSSSLEVLAALAFTDAEFTEKMMVKGGITPEFYKNYVAAVQSIIDRNAQLEFECLWRESIRTSLPNSILSDTLSLSIVKLNEQVRSTKLWDNINLRRVVLGEAFPDLLLREVGGLDVLAERIPESYCKSVFGSWLASRFVYGYGLEPSQFAFMEFMESYFERARAIGKE